MSSKPCQLELFAAVIVLIVGGLLYFFFCCCRQGRPWTTWRHGALSPYPMLDPPIRATLAAGGHYPREGNPSRGNFWITDSPSTGLRMGRNTLLLFGNFSTRGTSTSCCFIQNWPRFGTRRTAGGAARGRDGRLEDARAWPGGARGSGGDKIGRRRSGGGSSGFRRRSCSTMTPRQGGGVAATAAP